MKQKLNHKQTYYRISYHPLSLHVLHRRIMDKVIYVASFLLIVILISAFIPFYIEPNCVNATADTSVPSILTFSSTSSISRVAVLNNDSNSGSFVTSNNNDTVKFRIATNNYTGYTLKIKSSSGDTTLSNGEYSINSIGDVTTLTDFRNPSNTNYNNKWGLIPNKYASGDIIITNTNAYLPAPNTTGTILNITTSANSSDGISNPDEYSIGIGVRVDYNTVAGDYVTNALVLEYIANPITYSINYNANDGNNGANTTNMPTINPETGSVDATTTTITLSSKIPEREGFVFQGWCTTQVEDDAPCNEAGTSNPAPEYQPGDSYIISQTEANTITLHARWEGNSVITVHAGPGINTLSATNWTGTGTSTITKVYHIGDTIDLSSIVTPNFKTGYNTVGYSKTSGSGSLSGATFIVGAGNATITIKATALNNPVCTMQGGTTKVYNQSNTTLTATNNSSSYDTSSVNITYSFGYASSDTATLGNFGTASATNTTTIANNAYRGTRYYGVTVVVTDKTDSTITNSCTSGTGSDTGTNVANRTTMGLVNATINFNANGGTLNGANPIYTQFEDNHVFTTRIGDTTSSIPTLTAPDGYTFNGWYNANDGGDKILNADGGFTGSAITGWVNDSNQWVIENTSTTDNILYAHYTSNTYSLTITFAGSGVSNVKVCATSGNCSGDNLKGTVNASGESVSNLIYDNTYYLYPSFTSGYFIDNWKKTSSTGYLSNNANQNATTTATNPTFKMTAGNSAVTVTGKARLYMWNATSSDCGQTMYDNRDGTERPYSTARINNLCWMTSNLNLRGGITLNSTTTNLNNGKTSYYLPASTATGGFNMDDGTAYVYNSNSTSCSSSIGCYSYYSWNAAVAGDNRSSGNAPSDICPKGWRLPTKNEITTLSTTYTTGGAMLSSPFYGVYAGLIKQSNIESGSRGNYWSSTAYDSRNAYYITFNVRNTNIYEYTKYFGYSVRCVKS